MKANEMKHSKSASAYCITFVKNLLTKKTKKEFDVGISLKMFLIPLQLKKMYFSSFICVILI